MAINIWLTIPARQEVVRFMGVPLIQSFFWDNSQGTGRTVTTRGITPEAGRPFCQTAHSPSSRPPHRMSVSSHLEPWEVLSSVLETRQLVSLRAQHLREQEGTLRAFPSSVAEVLSSLFFITWFTSQSVPVSAGQTVEERKHWYLWVTGSYFLGGVHFTNFET